MKTLDGGDLIITFNVILPEKLSDERITYLRKLVPNTTKIGNYDTSNCIEYKLEPFDDLEDIEIEAENIELEDEPEGIACAQQ